MIAQGRLPALTNARFRDVAIAAVIVGALAVAVAVRAAATRSGLADGPAIGLVFGLALLVVAAAVLTLALWCAGCASFDAALGQPPGELGVQVGAQHRRRVAEAIAT